MSGIIALAGVTIVVPDLDLGVAAYRDWLGYVAGPIEFVGQDRAVFWQIPQAAPARCATLRPESGEDRFIRLVEGEPHPDHRPLTSLGWIAAEIIVQDVESLAVRLDASNSPFRVIGPPAVLDFEFTDQIKAMQVVGPGGEVLYLTEVGDAVPGFDLPAANSFVGQLFIMVLAAIDIADAAHCYSNPPHSLGPAIDARVEILSAALGLARDHRHRLATLALAESSLIEIDAFPAETPRCPISSVGLPSGIALVSFKGSGPAQMGFGRAGERYETTGDSIPE